MQGLLNVHGTHFLPPPPPFPAPGAQRPGCLQAAKMAEFSMAKELHQKWGGKGSKRVRSGGEEWDLIEKGGEGKERGRNRSPLKKRGGKKFKKKKKN